MSKRIAGFLLFSGAVALIAACGGTALTGGGSAGSGDPGAGGHPGSAGGPGAGGAPSVAGSPSAAGSPSSAGAGTSDRCSAPAESGQCDGYIPSFWHNPKSGLCEPFVYGGCGGNDNRYATREACLQACPGGGSNWGACKVDADCTLTYPGCCALCEPIDASGLLTLNASHLAEQMATRPCANVGACAPCPPASELSETGKYFRAVCDAGQCSLRDVRQSAETECTGGGKCVLRDGVNCCPGCDGRFVSVNSTANFCPNGPQPCPQCASTPPKGIIATCDGKRCGEAVLLP